MYSKCGCLEAAEMEGVVCPRMYVCICACMHPHLCLLSSEKREMVRFIYTRHSACFPSEKIGCERCQLYALSAVSVTLRVSQDNRLAELAH